MDVRQIIEFFKKPSSKIILGMVLILLTIVFIAPYISQIFIDKGKYAKQNFEEKELNTKTGIKAWKPVSFDINGDENSLREIPEEIERKKTMLQAQLTEAKAKEMSEINGTNGIKDIVPALPVEKKNNNVVALNIYNNDAANKEELKEYLPYGRIIPCELVITLQTSITSTPIIGIVTENVYNDGKLQIPAGAEVHGTTQGMPIRDHIMSGENWYIVWRTRDKDNGKELNLKGFALDNGSHWDAKHWDLLDGSAGIKGFTHDTRNVSQLKDIAVSAVSSIGSALQSAAQLSAIAPGGQGAGVATTAATGIGGAMAGATGSTAKVVAEQQLANVLESQYYVTSPAGTQFYLYVKQVINLQDAKIGASKSI